MKLKASSEFSAGKNGITWVGSQFKSAFYDMTFKKSVIIALDTKKLPRMMNDTEILAELAPEPVTLGDVLAFLKEADHGGWYLCYVKDAKGALWALDARWHAVSDGWYVAANSVSDPLKWLDGYQVFSRRFSVPQAKALSSSDALPFASREEFEELKERVLKLEYIIKNVRNAIGMV